MKTVLCIDDSNTIRTTLTLFISEFGYQVETAENGLDGLNRLESEDLEPSLIFLDVIMPELDGLGFLKKIKADEKLKYVPVCILSSVNQQDKIKEGMSLGACAWLIKPCQPPDIQKILSRYVG